jgi:hypothetical protein
VQGREDLLLKSIIKESGLPLKTFAKATGFLCRDALKWWSDIESINLKDKQIENFEKYFGVSMDASHFETIHLLRKRMFGEFQHLPLRYSVNAKSKARSSYYILRYLELLYGKIFVDKLLCSMLVHPRFFENLDREINLTFLNDLLSQCENIGFKDSDFKNLAQSMFLSIDNTLIEQEFLKCNNHKDFFITLSKLIGLFDTNFIYNFNPSQNSVEMTSKLCPEIEDALNENNQHIDKVLKYRPILFSQIPKLAKLSEIEVAVSDCQSRGDRLSRFHANFSQ